MDKFIGRQQEQQQLADCLASGQPEFVVVYGRRRIGKTFLVRQFFNDRFDFSYVGAHHFSQEEQLENFAEALCRHGLSSIPPRLDNWREAFRHLQELLERKPKNKRKVVFIDEMPWIDTHRSDFVRALENFWNGWGAQRNDLCFIACGSSTSWMVDKIVMNQGGLHNRMTRQIYLRPFTLRETEEYLQSKQCQWDRLQTLQCYMTVGGVPYYLSKMDTRKSLAQNIDQLFFTRNAPLSMEFDELYNALFNNADKYITIVRTLASHREGLSKQEIAGLTGISGGWLTRLLTNLERCDFIMSYNKFGSRQNNTIYRLTDFYTLFYFKFIEGQNNNDEHFWAHLLQSPAISNWQGHTFEIVGLTHLQQIKQGLQIGGILAQASTWRNKDKEHHYQIDLLIDRADRIINLCEMKFSTDRFIIDKDYRQRLSDRRAWFAYETRTRKSPVITFITTFGIMPNQYADVAQSQLTMDSLFI